MKKFYLFCSAGMSTSLLASKMQKVADANGLPIEVKAFPETSMQEIVESQHPDMILLGPQVKHILDKTVEQYADTTPVMLIDMTDYGTMNGERVLKRALLTYKEANK